MLDFFNANFGILDISHLSLKQLMICIFSSLLIGFIISLVYMLTHRKEGYISSYVMTVIILPATITLIILVIGDSTAAALGLLGAFSLVRFRSAPGDPKDIAYIFFAMSMGLACGIGYIGYSFIFTIILSAVLIIIQITKYGQPTTSQMTLKITIPENLNYIGLFDDVLAENTLAWKLRRVKTVDFGALYEVVFYIQMKENVDQKSFIDAIRALNGNLTVTLVMRDYSEFVDFS